VREHKGAEAHLPGAGVNGAEAPVACAPREAESQLRRLGRQEWWLWVTALAGSLLCAVAFLLLGFPQLFQLPPPFLRLDSDATARGLLALLLLFNFQLARRQWQFRNRRRQLTHQLAGPAEAEAQGDEYLPALPFDPLTGLLNQASAEPRLGKEMAQARRENKPLTLLMLAVDDWSGLAQRYSASFSELAVLEFARRLKRATRGSDLIVRSGDEEFLLVLRECGVKDIQRVLARIGAVEVHWAGQPVLVEYSSAWGDYQPGETPLQFLERVRQMLQLYKSTGDGGKGDEGSISLTL